MICAFLRAAERAEQLHRCSGGRLLRRHLVLSRAGPSAEPSWRWGLQGQGEAPRPWGLRGAPRRAVWTQGQGARRAEQDPSKQVPVPGSRGGEPAVPTAQRVKEAGRDFTYLLVVLIGIGITGGLFYVIFKELFSSSSPNKIYGKALDRCRLHPEVVSVFGEPLKGYGEMTRHGRRQHVSFVEYVKNGLKHMRVKFYIQGSEPGKQGTVHLEVRENPETGEYEFRYIFVDLDSYPGRTIVIEDNRS
ncbi:mitochondrial import inner membrane translocase subunit Tim21 [Sorex araneus]|uniref:mitochondrial import inner membrane translocase subunit Tim21 n=1 Tax=Sorex araneus TaxID=42254 RepID=UPI000331544F|nr:mitochondrial import inner membrane translocase subunit Tim21 [Sorex araneus]